MEYFTKKFTIASYTDEEEKQWLRDNGYITDDTDGDNDGSGNGSGAGGTDAELTATAAASAKRCRLQIQICGIYSRRISNRYDVCTRSTFTSCRRFM